MKIINVLLMGLLTCLAGETGVKAQQSVCPSGTCQCPNGCITCKDNSSCDCTCVGCCSSANLPFTPQLNTVYKFSSEAYFMCDSSEDLRPILLQGNVYTCSTNESTLVQPKLNQNIHIKIDPTVLYRFPEGMFFYCDKTPGVINEGLPSQYYICPVTPAHKTRTRAVK